MYEIWDKFGKVAQLISSQMLQKLLEDINSAYCHLAQNFKSLILRNVTIVSTNQNTQKLSNVVSNHEIC